MMTKESKDKAPTKSGSMSKLKSKVRVSLPTLRPLLINKPSYGEFPSPGPDDLGIWLNSPLPAIGGFFTARESLSLEPTLHEGVRLTRDQLNFFNKECSKIVDYIFLGSDAVARNRDALLQNGITHVLNCVGFICPEYFKDELVYKTLWLHDSPCEDITSILYDVFDYFEDVRETEGRVFVHCYQGVSRSASLVIAYLMWKDGQSFEESYRHVKAARGVTDPNMGFASQLLLCQKRVHALPASPNSMLRIYRMAPHCSYDSLHLVPKMLDEPSVKGLDSRGAFIINIPSAVYVWIGDQCNTMMAEKAKAAALQVIHYEKAQGPAIIIKEGEEPLEFWEALGIGMVDAGGGGQRHVQSYNIDFEIFHKAVSGGVVPPFPLPGNGIVTCLPARETGWSRLRKKFITGIIKDLINSSKLYSSTTGRSLDLSSRPSSSSVESFGKPASGYVSPLNSESSGSFALSQSSSNWFDFSNLDSYRPKVDSLDDPAVLLSDKEVFTPEETSSAIGSPKMFGAFSPRKRSSPTLAEGRGKIPAPETMLASVPSASQKPEKEESGDVKKGGSI